MSSASSWRIPRQVQPKSKRFPLWKRSIDLPLLLCLERWVLAVTFVLTRRLYNLTPSSTVGYQRKGSEGNSHRSVFYFFAHATCLSGVSKSVKVLAKMPTPKLWITPSLPVAEVEGRARRVELWTDSWQCEKNWPWISFFLWLVKECTQAARP